MKQKLLFILFFISYSCITAQTFVSGKILNEEESPLSGVQIFNMQNKKAVYTDAEGRFRIEASIGDEIRILTNQYNRREIIVSESTLKQEQNIKMNPSVREIAGVNILSKSQIENMKSKIGVPGPPEKPREKVPEVFRNLVLPLLGGTINVDNVYKIVSGDARRMKALYKYEDQQEYLTKLAMLPGDDFWEQSGIPSEKRTEFIQYLIGKKIISGKLSKEQLELAALPFTEEFRKPKSNP
nr:carboxypeptidase-like regulatory domain-containing protein [Elizabethkingia sp. ASV34]